MITQARELCRQLKPLLGRRIDGLWAAYVVAPDARERLAELLGVARSGYWHFGVAHQLVLERESACGDCHRPADTATVDPATQASLDSCLRCH